MLSYNKIVGERLKTFLLSKYNSINEAAENLDTTGSSLRNSYFNGKALPGSQMISKLLKLGCDISWLLDDENVSTELPKHPILQASQQKFYMRGLEEENYKLKEENKLLKKKVDDIEKISIRINEYFVDTDNKKIARGGRK